MGDIKNNKNGGQITGRTGLNGSGNYLPLDLGSTGDVLTIDGSNNIVWVTSFIYEIGQYVSTEGGVILHRWMSNSIGGAPEKGSVQNYLILDLNDLSIGTTWDFFGTNISGADSFWDGYTNTNDMMLAGASIGSAAEICSSSTNNGKSDWYLPSVDELKIAYTNRFDITLGLLSAGGSEIFPVAYWTSTEGSTTDSWFVDFESGQTNYNPKTDSYRVRSIRKFSI